MDYFGTGRLQNPAHDIDRDIVPVEQACRADEACFVLAFRGGIDFDYLIVRSGHRYRFLLHC